MCPRAFGPSDSCRLPSSYLPWRALRWPSSTRTWPASWPASSRCWMRASGPGRTWRGRGCTSAPREPRTGTTSKHRLQPPRRRTTRRSSSAGAQPCPSPRRACWRSTSSTTWKRMESSQTETFRPPVVKNEGECKKKVVAPFVPNAAVQVFPAMPAAFAAGGGLSGAAVAAVVGAGVAGGTGVVVAATNGGGPAPTTLAPVTTTQPPITVPATTTTTTLPPEVAFDPVFKVFNNGVLQTGTKIAGTEPLKLRFYMCESTGPLRLKFGVTVNGGLATAGCDTTITFTTGGFTTGLGAVVASRNGVESRGTSYSVVMQIVSDGPGNNPKANQPLTVDASPSCPTPTVTLDTPKAGQVFN